MNNDKYPDGWLFDYRDLDFHLTISKRVDEGQYAVQYGVAHTITISPVMQKVLHAFFSGEEPYRLYAEVVHEENEQQDQAFDKDVKLLRDLLRRVERKKETENKG